MFAQNAPGRTTHILTREYGRRFIELASRHRPKLFSKQQFALSRPPYSIGNHISWPDIKTDKQEFHGLRSPFRMDFENYTLGWLAEDRGNYDFQHVGYRKIRGQILWRVQQLGWTAEKFEHIDRAIESQRYHYGRAVDEHHKIDRYGKKYSWIAYFELHGWLKDRGLLKRADNDGRTSDVNIDPSFPSPTAEHRVICADLLGHPSLSLRDWIKKGPKPDFRPYLRQRAILNDSGPWVALDGYVTQQDEERGRRLFAFLRSFLVSSKDRKEFARRLNNQSLGGRWLPEKPESYYVFTGEIPWCEVFRQSGQTQLRFVISEKKVKRKRKQRLLYVDGKPTNLTVVDLMRFRISGMLEDLKIGDIEVTETDLARLEVRNRMVEVDETHQEFRKFRSMIPVCDFYLAGRLVDNVPTSGDVLAKELAQSAGLVHLPQTHDLQTRDGIRATYGTAVRAGDFNNTQTFFYIREHILTRLLQKLRMSLVWAVWGERQLSYKQIERARPGGDLAGFGHENFQSVHVLGKSRR